VRGRLRGAVRSVAADSQKSWRQHVVCRGRYVRIRSATRYVSADAVPAVVRPAQVVTGALYGPGAYSKSGTAGVCVEHLGGRGARPRLVTLVAKQNRDPNALLRERW